MWSQIEASKGRNGEKEVRNLPDHIISDTDTCYIAVLLVWVFCLQLTIGSLAYCVIGETSSTRLRNKTIGLGRISYIIFAIGFGIMTPYMIVRGLPLNVADGDRIPLRGTGAGKLVSSGLH